MFPKSCNGISPIAIHPLLLASFESNSDRRYLHSQAHYTHHFLFCVPQTNMPNAPHLHSRRLFRTSTTGCHFIRSVTLLYILLHKECPVLIATRWFLGFLFRNFPLSGNIFLGWNRLFCWHYILQRSVCLA
jgi:hypothetical protein